MTTINANTLDYQTIGKLVRESDEDCLIENCLGQRFIGAGLSGRRIEIRGIPGNALGAYLNGAEIEVFGNVQDAVGDTMNEGKIVVHGNIGDAAGYAMRGGMILVRGNAGYRAGIHMKAYREKMPIMVIGGRTGSFLGEYQAGGVIVVLGLHTDGKPIVGNYPCTGMHGGKLFLRSDSKDIIFPGQVHAHRADDEEKREIAEAVQAYCNAFGGDAQALLGDEFTVVSPDSKNPYKQMYVAN